MGGDRRLETVVEHTTLDSQFYEAAPKDNHRFLNEIKLATTARQQQLLAPQTSHGHAMNGDKEFAIQKNGIIVHHKYVNATISDIIEAIIRYNPGYATDVDAVKNERYELIRELKGWVTETLSHVKFKESYKKYNPRKLQDKQGNPFMGIELFNHTTISNPEDILRGLYLGSYMDSEYWRARTECFFEESHGMRMHMHRGLCTAGNLNKILEKGLSISRLAKIAALIKREKCDEGDGIIKLLMDEGLIVDFSKRSSEDIRKGVKNKLPYVPIFVEISKGYGVSDDAAFNYVSLKYGIEAGFGLILIDAVDTIDKCVPYIKEKGEDELLGDYITSQLGGFKGVEKYLGLKEQDIINLIFAAAVDPENHTQWPSCSQRRFLEYQHGNYALLNHIDYIKYIKEGAPYPDEIKLSIKAVPSNKFYKEFVKRIFKMESLGLIDRDDFHYARNVDYLLKKESGR